MCCLHATTYMIFLHYFRIWKHVPEYFCSVICSAQREVVLSKKKIEKSSSALTTSWSNFAVAELTPKWVYFLCRSLSSISISLIFWGALVSDHIIFYSMYNTKIAFTHSHTVHTAKPSLFQDFSISLNLLHHKSLIFSQYFSLTELALNCLSL